MSADDDDAIFPDSPPPATRRLRAEDGSPHPGYLSPGARKEKLRQQRGAARDAVGAPQAAKRERKSKPLPYPELRVASAFSFLDASSLPEDLVARAAELELPAVALADRSGVYGAPRFYKAAKEAGLRALVGAEVMLRTADATPSRSPRALRALAMTREWAAPPLPTPSIQYPAPSIRLHFPLHEPHYRH